MNAHLKKAGPLTAIAAGAFIISGCESSDSRIKGHMDFEATDNTLSITVTHTACTNDDHLVTFKDTSQYRLQKELPLGRLPPGAQRGLKNAYNQHVTPHMDEMTNLMIGHMSAADVNALYVDQLQGLSKDEIAALVDKAFDASMQVMSYGIDNMLTFMNDQMIYADKAYDILRHYAEESSLFGLSAPDSDDLVTQVQVSAAPAPQCR